MRKTFARLAVLSACAALFVGCDSQQAQINEAQRRLDSALAVFASAQQGYAPVVNEKPQDLQDFRQQQLQSAVPDLEAVIASGNAQQKATASRLLASVHSSAARYATRRALVDFASLGARTPVLDAILHGVERTAARAAAADVNYDEQLADLAADANALQQKQTELRTQAEQLQQQIAAEQAKRDQWRTKAQAAAAEARAAYEAAFIAQGDAKIERQEAGAAADRAAGEASAEAERHEIQIDLLQRRLAVIDAQLETLTSQIADLRQRAEATRALQADAQAAVAAANALRDEQAAGLREEFNALAAAYGRVSDQLAAAAERATAAVQLLDTAGATADEKLAGRLDEAFVNTERAMLASTWASIVERVANVTEEVGLSDAAQYREAYEQVAADHAAAAESARAAIAAARELAGDDADARARLDQYTQHLGG